MEHEINVEPRLDTATRIAPFADQHGFRIFFVEPAAIGEPKIAHPLPDYTAQIQWKTVKRPEGSNVQVRGKKVPFPTIEMADHKGFETKSTKGT
jgi:hypothetical protein